VVLYSVIMHNIQSPNTFDLDYKNLIDKMLISFAYHQLITDENGKGIDYVFLEVNKAFEESTGLLRENILGKKVTEVIPGIKNDEAHWIERYAKVASTGVEEKFESYSEKFDTWFKIYAFSPERNFFAVMFEDIGEEKKRVEENLTYKLLLDKTSDMVSILDTQGTPAYLFVNKAYEHILGYKSADLIGKSILEFVHPEDSHLLQTFFTDTLHSAARISSKKITYRYRKSSSEYVVTESTIDIIDTRIFIVSRDVTTQAIYIEKLQAERRRTENYFNIAASILIVIDANGIVTKINKSGCELLEDTEEHIVGKNWIQEFIPEDERERVQNVHTKIFEDTTSHEYVENHVKTKSGAQKLVLWHNKILTNKKGEPIGTLSSGEDITLRRETERANANNFMEIEKFNKLAIGRELKMVALKNEIKRLEEELKAATR